MKTRKFTTKHAFAMVSLIYLAIEAQAWVFISRLYTTTLTPLLLSEYERFGYASAGLGVMLIVARMIYPRVSQRSHQLVLAFTLPAVYVLAVWAMYETVTRSPAWIPENERHHAAQAAIATLASPSWENLLLYYGSETPENTHISHNARLAVEKYPLSDRAVQAIYIQGIRSVDMFAQYYQKSADLLDREILALLLEDVGHKAYFDLEAQLRLDDIELKAMRFEIVMRYYRHIPSKWLSALILGSYAYENDPVLRLIVEDNFKPYIDEGRFVVNKYDASKLADVAFESYVWDKLKVKIPNLPDYEPGPSDFLERFRVAYSRAILDKYTYLPTVTLPWKGDHDAPLSSSGYNRALKALVPFFVDQEGKMLITPARIYQDDMRHKYINTLTLGLPSPIREAWNRYQQDSLTRLSMSPEAWKSPTEYDIHKDTLRIGAVIPVFVLLSGVLILLNVINLFATKPAYGVIGASIVVLTYSGSLSFMETPLLKAVLAISVKETQIFLY